MLKRMTPALLIPAMAAMTFSTTSPPPAFGHCQIPCGIYDDDARIKSMGEHITTIEKSMKSIQQLSGNSAHTATQANQMVRWVMNKENHANQLMDIVTDYFMTQKLALPDPADKKASDAYLTKLTTLHHMLIYAMKAKQTTDLQYVEKLRALNHTFSHLHQGKGEAGLKNPHK